MKYRNLKRLAIVTPHPRFPLTPDQLISLRHLRTCFSDFDRFLVCPESSTPELPDFTLLRVPDKHLASVWAYNQLVLSRWFYERFSNYEYILIYQLDCLVFSGEILPWCDQGWDYVGAPWFRDFGNDPAGGFHGVGNGGFSLRKVKSHLDVLTSRALPHEPVSLGWRDCHSYGSTLAREVVCRFKTVLHRFGFKNNVSAYLKDYGKQIHEDLFWSFEARRFKPDFRIPTPEQALSFAFECAPRTCYELNGRRLPLGCHAWARYDRAFWEEFLLTDDSKELVERSA